MHDVSLHPFDETLLVSTWFDVLYQLSRVVVLFSALKIGARGRKASCVQGIFAGRQLVYN